MVEGGDSYYGGKLLFQKRTIECGFHDTPKSTPNIIGRF